MKIRLVVLAAIILIGIGLVVAYLHSRNRDGGATSVQPFETANPLEDRPDPTEPRPATEKLEAGEKDIQLARGLFRELPGEHSALSFGERAAQKIKAENLDVEALSRGFLWLLQKGDDREKHDALNFFSAIPNRAVTKQLLASTNDANASIRSFAISALLATGASDTAVREKLTLLRDKDPSLDVRVYAALGLDSPSDAANIEVFQKALRSPTCDSRVRRGCEETLEAMGKLTLPLPPEAYIEIDRMKYEEIGRNKLQYKILRETKKDGIIYLEVIRQAAHVPLERCPSFWYRVSK